MSFDDIPMLCYFSLFLMCFNFELHTYPLCVLINYCIARISNIPNPQQIVISWSNCVCKLELASEKKTAVFFTICNKTEVLMFLALILMDLVKGSKELHCTNG